jgi:hypothetical protein
VFRQAWETRRHKRPIFTLPHTTARALNLPHHRLVPKQRNPLPRLNAILQKQGLLEASRQFIQSGRPFLGICVGYQALFERSDEFNSCAAGLTTHKRRQKPRNAALPRPGLAQRIRPSSKLITLV